MKRIHFDNMKSWFWITILILSLIFILTGTFELFDFENPKLNKRISAIGFLLQVLFYSRMFWYKNYVQWNSRGILIRIKSFLGKNIKFKEIISSELTNKKLILKTVYGNKIEFDLSEIVESDSKKLYEIIRKNTIANNV